MDIKELTQLREHYDASMALVHKWGLKPFETDFHVVPADRIYEIASYGVPGHFSHWTYGRDYWMQKQQYDYGRSKIYELVINSDPAQAFLLETNSLLENMFVISHVLGHSDFFANNRHFEFTNRSVEVSTTAVAERFRQYEIEHGRFVIEQFIDDVMTINRYVRRSQRIKEKTVDYEVAYMDDPYEDLFPEVAEVRRGEELTEKTRKRHRHPYAPEEDVLRFIAENARLQDWQRDVLMSMREEALYFQPQIMTKIMNEGWASLIHRCSMHTLDPEVDPGGFDFAHLHSGVLSQVPGTINPYWLGYNLFMRVIEVFGEHTRSEMENLDFIGSEGWEKALEIREFDNDSSFVRNFLDEETCERLDLFEYGYVEKEKAWLVTEKEWEKVRDTLVDSIGMSQIPLIDVVDSNYANKGVLQLQHRFDGRPLDEHYAKGTLPAIERLWGRPVCLETRGDGDKHAQWGCIDGEVTVLEGGKVCEF